MIDRAFPVIRERILEANTADVDSVTAATFSSYAIKTAVADAMQQAGLEAPRLPCRTREDRDGARGGELRYRDRRRGPAGLAAAISAKQTNADKNVILVEKLDILSGNGKFDMNFFDMINTEAQKAAGNDEWVGEAGLAKFIEEKSANGESAERIQVWANEEYGIDAWLRAMGVELNYNYGGTNHMAEDNQYSGEVIQAGLEKAAAELGVDVRTGTKGMDLVMEDGVCKGVVVTNNANETYTINAKSTIIATGGFCSNKELLAEYAPGYEVFNTSNQMGTTGDFVKIFEQNGFKMENMGKMSFFSNIIVPYRDLTGGADMNLLANSEGAPAEQVRHGSRHDDQEQPNGAAYYITDKTGYDSFYRIRKHVGLGYYSEGATLEELAEKLGIDAEGLKASVEQYNADAAAGTENAQVAAVPKRALDAEGPYYGVRVEAANHMTKGGVVCNENAQVLNADDTVVPGLYAAGEVTWQAGGYSESVCFGKVAGAQAAMAE
ncbi:MAG: FAD-binding protein [Christensenellales bacterium]